MPVLDQADLVSWGEKRCLVLGGDAQLGHHPSVDGQITAACSQQSAGAQG